MTAVRSPSLPDRHATVGAQRSSAPQPVLARVSRAALPLCDRFIGGCSLVTTDAVLDMRDFDWTDGLRADWQAIREEAVAVAGPDGRWRDLPLWDDGGPVDADLTNCPKTAAALARIPELESAAFSILPPGAHLRSPRGVTKGLVTCHLGLIVPRDGDVRMRVHDRVVRWAEGETLVFDDTYHRESWNDAGATRVVLLARFRRPLRQPGKWLAERLMGIARRLPRHGRSTPAVRTDGCFAARP